MTKKPRGRPEERVVIEGDWREAVAKAFQTAAMPKAKPKKARKKK